MASGSTLKEVAEMSAAEYGAWVEAVDHGPTPDKIPTLLAVILSSLASLSGKKRVFPWEFAPWLTPEGSEERKAENIRADNLQRAANPDIIKQLKERFAENG